MKKISWIFAKMVELSPFKLCQLQLWQPSRNNTFPIKTMHIL